MNYIPLDSFAFFLHILGEELEENLDKDWCDLIMKKVFARIEGTHPILRSEISKALIIMNEAYTKLDEDSDEANLVTLA